MPVFSFLIFVIFFLSHAQELELVEDVWRGEVQDLLSQITRLQAENKRLLASLPLKEPPVAEEDSQKQEGGLSAAIALNQSLTADGRFLDYLWDECSISFFFTDLLLSQVFSYSLLSFSDGIT